MTFIILFIGVIIYKTTNLINGKIYVGQDFYNNSDYLGSGVYLNRAIKKYGKENFTKEILQECSNKDELNDRERFWIKELKSNNRELGYNLTEGGTGGDTYSLQTEERKELIKNKHSNHSTEYYSDEKNRIKQAEITREIWKRPGHKEKVVKALIGREISWGDKISKSLKEYNKHNQRILSEFTKQKLREKMTGYEFKLITDETKKRILELYQTIGPKLISETLLKDNIIVSQYLIRRFLKKEGVYQRYQKGIGSKEQRRASINWRAQGNPNYGKKQSPELIQKRIKAINLAHKNNDKIIRIFVNTETEEKFVGTAYDFRIKYSLDYFGVRKIVRGIQKSHAGWSIKTERQSK